MKAWIVTWDWAGNAAALADEVAAILPPRWSAQRVAEHVQAIYALRTNTVSELAAYACHPSDNPYRAKVGHFERILCGHNPFLYARKVSELMVTEDSHTSLEVVSWRYEISTTGLPKRVAEGDMVTIHRRIWGPLRAYSVWDRLHGRYKPGWGPGETPTRDDD